MARGPEGAGLETRTAEPTSCARAPGSWSGLERGCPPAPHAELTGRPGSPAPAHGCWEQTRDPGLPRPLPVHAESPGKARPRSSCDLRPGMPPF